MKDNLLKLVSIITGRVARNVYLWIFAIYMRFSYNDFNYSTTEVAYMGVSLLLLLSLLYGNNLLLVPSLLSRKKAWVYYPVAAVALLVCSFVSGSIIMHAVRHVHGIDTDKIVWVPMSKEGITELSMAVVVHVLTYGLLMLIFTLFWYLADYRHKQAELAEVKKEQAELELMFLKNQLNPHFLFNTLNNLYGLALQKAEDTPGAILKLSIILRYLLYESNAPLVSFDREREIMEAYIELEMLRLPSADNSTFLMTVDRAYSVPPLLWLPLLENMFKHGTRYISDTFSMEYRCTLRDNKWRICTQNSFGQSGNAAEQQPGGIGLDNLRKRLQLLYPGKYSIRTESVENVYITDLEIDLS